MFKQQANLALTSRWQSFLGNVGVFVCSWFDFLPVWDVTLVFFTFFVRKVNDEIEPQTWDTTKNAIKIICWIS